MIARGQSMPRLKVGNERPGSDAPDSALRNAVRFLCGCAELLWMKELFMNTILITGSSSGFGLETARYFLDRDWTVIATMRTPRGDLLPASERLRVVALDVTDAANITRALDEAGPIDALVNNAGAGLMGALE